MGNELIRPLDSETAKAIEETAKAAGKGLDLASKAGSYAADVFARSPHDLIGYLIGDRLYHARIRQWTKLSARTAEILRERGVTEPVDASPSVEVPLVEAAIDETREELSEIWARLLASARDPKRSRHVRGSLISILKQLDLSMR